MNPGGDPALFVGHFPDGLYFMDGSWLWGIEMLRRLLFVLLATCSASVAAAERELTPAERGQKSLETTATIKAFWPKVSYDNAWKVWGLKEKPANYAALFRECQLRVLLLPHRVPLRYQDRNQYDVHNHL